MGVRGKVSSLTESATLKSNVVSSSLGSSTLERLFRWISSSLDYELRFNRNFVNLTGDDASHLALNWLCFSAEKQTALNILSFV